MSASPVVCVPSGGDPTPPSGCISRDFVLLKVCVGVLSRGETKDFSEDPKGPSEISKDFSEDSKDISQVSKDSWISFTPSAS